MTENGDDTHGKSFGENYFRLFSSRFLFLGRGGFKKKVISRI